MRPYSLRLGCGLALTAALMAGCTPERRSDHVATEISFANRMFIWNPQPHPIDPGMQTRAVQGQARVLAIEPVLGTVRLQTDSGERLGWWENRITYAQPDGTATRENPFPARVGDRIQFHALEMNGDLYITAAQVIRR